MKHLCLAFGFFLVFNAMKTSAAESENTIYDSNPKHLWNRLNETLFVRTAQDGKKYGLDELDILYWVRTKNLLVEPSHQQALTILDEFINTHGEKLIRNPLKRALLQRDLWELFDWSAVFQSKTNNEQSREKLQQRLVIVIRRLALTTNEISLLPNNYAQAEKDKLPELPRGLFQTNGAWVNVVVNGIDPTAAVHVRGFSGRSTFLVMLHHPDGRKAGIDYLNRLRSFVPMWVYETNSSFPNEPRQNPDLPQFPKNTQWALVRRMSVIDTEGRIQPTEIVESIQMRTYLDIPKTKNQSIPSQTLLGEAQRFDEFRMSHKSNAVLAAIPKGENGFNFVQLSIGEDPFEFQSPREAIPDSSTFKGEVLKSCVECHAFGPGIHSVNTFSRAFSGVPSFQTTQISDSSIESEFTATIYWKQRQFDWGLLQGLWRQAD